MATRPGDSESLTDRTPGREAATESAANFNQFESEQLSPSLSLRLYLAGGGRRRRRRRRRPWPDLRKSERRA